MPEPTSAPATEPIHVLRPSPARRVLGAAIQCALGALLLWLALAQPPESLMWRLFLLVLGAGALAFGVHGWRASSRGIVYSVDGLHSEDGRRIVHVDDIASVDRGAFAFKPSNGFVLRLRSPAGSAWAPGMWWRLGKRVGVGGVIAGSDAKFVADALAMQVAERD